MVFLADSEKLLYKEDMILLGISTQAEIIQVGLHLCLAAHQCVRQGPVSNHTYDFLHQLLKQGRGICDTNGHALSSEDEINSWAPQVQSTCQKPLHLSILVLIPT